MAVNAVYKDDFSAENKMLLEYNIGEYLDEGKFVDIESEIVSVDLKPTNGTIVLKSCVDDYVNKPFMPLEIKEIIHSIFNY